MGSLDATRPRTPAGECAKRGRADRRHRLLLAGVLVLAFAARLGWIGAASLDPGDGEYFDQVFYELTARQLVAGNGYTRLDGTPTAVWPPLYPLFLAGFYGVTGGETFSGRLANPFFGVLTTFFTWWIGAMLVGRRAGLVAGLLIALCPDEIFFSNFVMSEAPFGAVFTGAIALFVRLDRARPEVSTATWMLLGGAVGLACLTRGIAVVWLAVPGLVWWVGTRSLWTAVSRSAFVLLGCAVVLSPWTLRNAIAMDAFIPIATSGGRTLAHAHSPFQEGGASLKGLIYWRRVADRYADVPQPEREVLISRVLTRESLAYLIEHPGHELRIMPARIASLLGHGHVGLEIGRRQLPSGRRDPIFGPGWNRVITGAADLQWYVLLALGVAGLPGFFRRRASTLLVVPVSLGALLVAHTLVFPDDPRYHLPMLPLLAVSAGSVLVGLSDRLRARGGGAQAT